MTSVMADRTKRLYGAAIDSDELVTDPPLTSYHERSPGCGCVGEIMRC